ncbi:MAG TPA: cupin domain-containing protein [Lacunisphaera sp.]|nr:cupin domain-containing protein [Lacunisphaera sp.]
MNSILQVFAPLAPAFTATSVLAQNGFTCTLLTLEPGAESILPASASTDDQILFVVDGTVAIHTDDLTTILHWGEAFLLRPGRTAALSARSDLTVRVLRVEIPPRQVVTPQIITP